MCNEFMQYLPQLLNAPYFDNEIFNFDIFIADRLVSSRGANIHQSTFPCQMFEKLFKKWRSHRFPYDINAILV